MKNERFLKTAYLSLAVNFAYAVGNCVLGIIEGTWWFITLGLYYAVLCLLRLCSLLIKRRARGEWEAENVAKSTTGWLLLLLAFCLIGVVWLSVIDMHGTRHGEIIMITLAAYAFSKLTLGIIGLAGSKNHPSPVVKTLRNITLADTVVSIFSLQRSMLVSFPGMKDGEIRLFNLLTGVGVCIIIMLLGINLIGGRKTEMAKSKIVKAGKKISDAVVKGYKKVEDGVVGGYKKVEETVVDGYKSIEDKFIDTYLTKDGESVEEARERLKKKDKE